MVPSGRFATRRVLSAAAIAAASIPVGAQVMPPVVSVDASLIAQDNSSANAASPQRRELITSLRPQVTYVRRGPNLELVLEASAKLVAYAQGTQRDGILPAARVSLKVNAIERLLSIEAQARISQSEIDAYGLRVDDTYAANRRTERGLRVSPIIERELLPNMWLLARHDASFTSNAAGAGSQLESHNNLIRVERKPLPLGLALEWSRLDTQTRDVAQSRYTLETARVRASVNLGGELLLGAMAGRDQSRLTLSNRAESIYGVSARWNPGPRTEVVADIEHRVFGSAGSLSLRHRTPFMSLTLAAGRQPVVASASLGILGRGADMRSFLDAILTTRYPDPAARASLVDTLVASRGLDVRSPNPIDVVAEYPQLETVARATWALHGARNTASVTLYSQTLRRLANRDDPLVPPAGVASDSQQRGASAQFNRRLSAQLSATASLRWSKITGLAARDGDVSQDASAALSLLQNLSPRTNISAGVQRTRFTSTVVGQDSTNSTLVSVGMNHRF